MSAAPGISINSVLTAAPDEKLRSFVGLPIVNVLSALNPKLLTRDNLVEIACQSAEPLEMLRRDGLREQIISLLPIPKARELAEKLGIQDKEPLLYDRIIDKTSDRQTEPVLRSFFGVVVPDRAPGMSVLTEVEVKPNYGLFPHQRQVAEDTLRVLEKHPNKVVIHMPTGAGKTRTAMHIVSDILNRNPNRLVVWLAQTAELLEQAAEEFEKAWRSLGAFPAKVFRFWGDHTPNISEIRAGFLVAGFGKLYALSMRDGNMILRLGDRAVLTVVDEAHQAIAPTYRALICCLHEKKPGNALLGLTATPGRTWSDIEADKALAEFFGNRKVMLRFPGYTNPVQYLIDQDYLARPTFHTLNTDPGFKLTKADVRELARVHEISEKVLDRLAADEQRSIRIITAVEELIGRHQRVIVFASTISHAHLLASILKLRDIEAFVVTGYTDRLSRERILARFKSPAPEPIVVCNYGVLTTGFDAPMTSAVVIARPTRSLVLFSQMVGRAIRGTRAEGNREAEIVTVVDPQLPGFGSMVDAFMNWEDVWNEQ